MTITNLLTLNQISVSSKFYQEREFPKSNPYFKEGEQVGKFNSRYDEALWNTLFSCKDELTCKDSAEVRRDKPPAYKAPDWIFSTNPFKVLDAVNAAPTLDNKICDWKDKEIQVVLGNEVYSIRTDDWKTDQLFKFNVQAAPFEFIKANPSGTVSCFGGKKLVVLNDNVLKRSTKRFVPKKQALDKSYSCVDWKDDHVLYLGSSRGISCIDTRSLKPFNVLSQTNRRISILKLHPENNTLLTGSENGDIVVFDLAKLDSKQIPMLTNAELKGKITELESNPETPKIFAATDQFAKTILFDINQNKVVSSLSSSENISGFAWLDGNNFIRNVHKENGINEVQICEFNRLSKVVQVVSTVYCNSHLNEIYLSPRKDAFCSITNEEELVFWKIKNNKESINQIKSSLSSFELILR